MRRRNFEILNAIVRGYIATGEPVGSRTISEKRRDGLSPASIRNVMAELETEGYLTHPHTSAGRVPTDKGFRSYVENVSARRLQPSEADYVQAVLSEATSLEERMGQSSRVLATLTRQVGIVVSAPLSQAVLEHIQILQLSEGRLLVVLVSRGDVVQHRIIRLGETIPVEELERIANYVNRNFVGWKLDAARGEIQRRIEQERATYDAILRRLRLLYLAGFLCGERQAQVYLEGTPNLIAGIDNVDTERLSRLLQALAEKERLIELLDECLHEDKRASVRKGPNQKPLLVRIGLEEAYPGMKNLALVGTFCALEPGLDGRIAVIGPTRMHYERVMSAVAHVARVFYSLAEASN